MSNYKTIILEKFQESHIASITLNRPEKLNAINDLMMDELNAALDEIELDSSMWVVILKGAGKSFSVGQDLSGAPDTMESSPRDPREKPYMSDMWDTANRNMARFRRIYDFARPIVAQVHGYCLGTGCDIAVCCRAVLASEDAVFGDPSVRLGMATRNPLWTWRIGLKKTTELLLTGQYIDAVEAERIGLVSKTVPFDDLAEEAFVAAEVFAKGSSMGGLDQEVSWRSCLNNVFDACGMSTAWRFTTNISALSQVQRSGRAITNRGGLDFWGIREKVSQGRTRRQGQSVQGVFPQSTGPNPILMVAL